MPKDVTSGKRFYETVDVIPVAGGYGITLDGRAVPTPLGKTLLVQAKALADAIADEWRAQGDAIDPRSMPISGLANTAIDRTGLTRDDVIEGTLGFAARDLLCYRVDDPDDLCQRQHECWQPLLDWATDTLKIKFNTTTGLLAVSQPPENADIVKRTLQGLDDIDLTAVAVLTAATGSLIIALAVSRGRINADDAFHAAELEEIHQNERWGKDEEARERQDNLHADIIAAAKFMTLARSLV